MRPYYVPLNYDFPKNLTNFSYNTSSFWRHLGDLYHRSRFKFLQDYTDAAAPIYGGGREDWLRWLDERLKNDPRIKTPLHLVLPGFLTDRAGQWAAGGIGERFSRSTWLTEAFGGCESVTVSPQAPYVEIDVGLHKVAGKCLSVTIRGLGASDLAAVKVGALTEREDIADSLHLGWAFTNDQTGFNCARVTREGKLPQGIAGCLLEPVTGEFETPVGSWPAVRMWNASSLEYGPGAQSKGGAGGDIENVYVLSYVPTEPWEEKLEGKPPITVKLGVGLDWSTLSIDGSDVSTGASDGTRRSTRTRAAGALGNKPTATDRILPASTGYVDLGPVEALFGQAAIGQIASMNETLGAMNDQFAGLVGFGVEVFRLAEVEVTPLGGPVPYDNEELEVLREFTVATEEKLPVGTTGTFEAGVYGVDLNKPGILLITREDDPATLTVLENSRGAFRARVRGRVCEFDMNAARAGNPKRCEPFHQISGEISKPFAYLYQATSELVSHQTEGEKLYNKYMVARSGTGGLSASGAGSASTRPGAGPAGSSGTTEGGALQCACTCPDQVAPQTAQCQTQCAPQLAMCSAVGAGSSTTEPASASRPPTPTLEAQRKWFSRLVSGQGLQREIEDMLIEDFATMSDETRAYLIRQYRHGVE